MNVIPIRANTALPQNEMAGAFLIPADEYQDKRAHPRYSGDGELRWALFNTSDFVQANVENYAKGGLAFNTSVYLSPGANLIIRMENGAMKRGRRIVGEGYPTLKVGEVRWCQKNERANGDQPYRVGVRYHGLYDY